MNSICCPVCSVPLSFSVAKGRKSNKPFIMLKCEHDGRHFRAFITDQEYVRQVLKERGSKNGENEKTKHENGA